MNAFIENPRRAPRAPVRCSARVAVKEGGFWASPTSDYGPRGCQLVGPAPLSPGGRIYLELHNDRIPRPVQLEGRIAWCARTPPWRMGVAFDAGSLPAARSFFDRLAAHYPGIDTYGRAPDRIADEAPLAPARPPAEEPLLTDEEARVLRALGPGRCAGSLVDALEGRGAEAAVNAVFSLLGRRYVVVGPPDGEAAAGWAVLLAARGGSDVVPRPTLV